MSSKLVVHCTFPGLGLTVRRKEPKRKEEKVHYDTTIRPCVFYLYIEPNNINKNGKKYKEK